MAIFKLLLLSAVLMTSVVLGKPRSKRGVRVYSNREFFTYPEIVENMEQLEHDFDHFTKRVPFGQKTDGGNQMYYQLMHNSQKVYHFSRPWIVVAAGLHGDDWLATGAVMYFMQKFMNEFEELDVDAQKMLNTFNWVVIPVSNPDGYQYTRKPGKRGWWMNTRYVNETDCLGVDLNKNFMFLNQLVDIQCGSSYSATDHASYSGPEPFSETESQAIRDLVKSLGKKFVGFVSVFDKGQAVIAPPLARTDHDLQAATPFGKLFYKLDETNRVGPLIAEAMTAVDGDDVKHTWGKYNDVFFNQYIQGTAVDYFQYKYPGIYSYQIHLWPGARVPKRPGITKIENAGQELYAGLLAMVNGIDSDYLNRLIRLPYGQA